VIGEPDGKGGYVTRLYRHPLVPWIFLGAFMMFGGGIVSLSDRRHRIGAPLRKNRVNRPAAPDEAQSSTATEAPPLAAKSKLYLIPVIAFALLAGFFTYRLHLVEEGDTPSLIPSVMIDKPAPNFSLPPLLAGEKSISGADLRGQVTLVNFFASWCVPCRAEHPYLAGLPSGLITLVGINYKDRPEDAKAWIAQLGNPYKNIGRDNEGRTAIDFGVYGVPESYLIDKQGVIRFKQTGPLTPDIIEKTIIPLAKRLNQ
jgi:DsbE subfamily thiol:disulfide oxidoreductase